MNNVHYRSETLEAIARKILLKHDPFYLNASPQAVPIERIIEDDFGLDIRYKHLTNNGRILGKTIFDDGYTPYYDLENHRYELMRVEKGTMIIEAILLAADKLGRLRFTQAHELAHWVIHQELYAGTGEVAALLSSDQDTAAEWQANALATAILMPVGQVKRCFYDNRAGGYKQQEIVERMSLLFGVSKKAMSIRLESRGLI